MFLAANACLGKTIHRRVRATGDNLIGRNSADPGEGFEFLLGSGVEID